jgi:hypothetical protein
MQKKYMELIDETLTMFDYIRCGQVNLGKDIFDNSVDSLRHDIKERIQALYPEVGDKVCKEYDKILKTISGPDEKFIESKTKEINDRFENHCKVHQNQFQLINKQKRNAVMNFQFDEAEKICKEEEESLEKIIKALQTLLKKALELELFDISMKIQKHIIDKYRKFSNTSPWYYISYDSSVLLYYA